MTAYLCLISVFLISLTYYDIFGAGFAKVTAFIVVNLVFFKRTKRVKMHRLRWVKLAVASANLFLLIF